MNRRALLKSFRSGLVAAAASSSFPLFALAADRKEKRPVALLVPLTGPRGQLGLSMREAALLAENRDYLPVFDTKGTPEGAAAAAAQAIRRGAAMILGPLLAAEVPAVAGTVAGRVPVIAFSNDAVLKAPGLYIFGITARQATSAILRYARGRGVHSVSVIEDGTPWSVAAAAAAGTLESELGITVRVLQVREGQPLPDPGEAPDAVLLPGSGAAVLSAARALKATGIQILGTLQALDHRPEALGVLDGAWIAAPDPTAFAEFASGFRARSGGDPGMITALAYDAAGIANNLRAAGQLGAQGLLASDGFQCVTGPVRFRTDGSVARDFAILVARADGYEAVAVSSGS